MRTSRARSWACFARSHARPLAATTRRARALVPRDLRRGGRRSDPEFDLRALARPGQPAPGSAPVRPLGPGRLARPRRGRAYDAGPRSPGPAAPPAAGLDARDVGARVRAGARMALGPGLELRLAGGPVRLLGARAAAPRAQPRDLGLALDVVHVALPDRRVPGSGPCAWSRAPLGLPRAVVDRGRGLRGGHVDRPVACRAPTHRHGLDRLLGLRAVVARGQRARDLEVQRGAPERGLALPRVARPRARASFERGARLAVGPGARTPSPGAALRPGSPGVARPQDAAVGGRPMDTAPTGCLLQARPGAS